MIAKEQILVPGFQNDERSSHTAEDSRRHGIGEQSSTPSPVLLAYWNSGPVRLRGRLPCSVSKMRETRLTLLPDERFTQLLPALDESLASMGRSITADNFASLLDETMRRVLHMAFKQAAADEGTVWLVEESTKTLAAAYNTGPNAEKLVGRFKQPLSAGLISMVFASEQPFIENEIFKNPEQDKSLDSMLQLQTYAMIATPLYFLNACRGVISCVQLAVPGSTAPLPRGFHETDEAAVRHCAATLGSLIDYRVLRSALGLE
jgi:hypothetical protein